MTQELVIISGKGGTGKTSLTASFAALSKKAVLADCDVDAADLHLLIQPKILNKNDFFSGYKAVIRQADCSKCGNCLENCRFDAVMLDKKSLFSIDPIACEGCGVCVKFCPAHAIDFPQQICGEWMISNTKFGPMVNAKLKAGAENSGKLVALVRQKAREIAKINKLPLVLVDGPPGIGCPVIASITGATFVIVVTEPTVSGIHDLERVLELTRHFNIPTGVCINKWDINPDSTTQIENQLIQKGIIMLGRIRYDSMVTKALVNGQTIVESECVAAQDVKYIWKNIVNWSENVKSNEKPLVMK